MSKTDDNTVLYELRKKIQDIRTELDALGSPIPDMPELITSTNLLRSNEYLVKITKRQDELLSVYVQYSKALEGMIAEIFAIQNDLTIILKEQSKLISNTTSEILYDRKRKPATIKRKSSKK